MKKDYNGKPFYKIPEHELLDLIIHFCQEYNITGSSYDFSIYAAVLNERKRALDYQKEIKKNSE